MGGRPSHPELLDWLALDFRENGLGRKNVFYTSNCYCLRPIGNPHELTPQLPRNRSEETACLARRARGIGWIGEMLRDTALAASGLLVEKIGGPSVKPYQPAGSVGSRKPSRQRHKKLYARPWRVFVPAQSLHFFGNEWRRCPIWTPWMCPWRDARMQPARQRNRHSAASFWS